jgi:hypothetical protein
MLVISVSITIPATEIATVCYGQYQVGHFPVALIFISFFKKIGVVFDLFPEDAVSSTVNGKIHTALVFVIISRCVTATGWAGGDCFLIGIHYV